MKTIFNISGVIILCAISIGISFGQPNITVKGGPGDTPETAVVISGAADSMAGISAEYDWLAQKFGRKNVDWSLRRQSVMQQQGKVYDRMEIELKDGSRRIVFFDISGFFGKL